MQGMHGIEGHFPLALYSSHALRTLYVLMGRALHSLHPLRTSGDFHETEAGAIQPVLFPNQLILALDSLRIDQSYDPSTDLA